MENTKTVLKWRHLGGGIYEATHNGDLFKVVRMDESPTPLWNLFINGTCDDSYATKWQAQIDAEMFIASDAETDYEEHS